MCRVYFQGKFRSGNICGGSRKGHCNSHDKGQGTPQVFTHKPQVPLTVQGRHNSHTQPVMRVQLVSGPGQVFEL